MSKVGVVNIRGKDYVTVAYRVALFRAKYPNHTVNNVIVENTENRVLMRCEIADEHGRLVQSAHAEEFRAASQINKTSALENAETSALGRALAQFGIASDEQIASADEVLNAIAQQEGPTPGKPEARSELDYFVLRAEYDGDYEGFMRYYIKADQDLRTEIFNAAPTGKKGEWKNELRQMEQEFHARMDMIQDQVIECCLEKQCSSLMEVLDEVEDWEKPYLWARLTDTEKQYIKECKQ